jgi:hypothetical protein
MLALQKLLDDRVRHQYDIEQQQNPSLELQKIKNKSGN